MGSGDGPQPQPPEEDRPRDPSDGWRPGDQGSVRLIRGHESDPSNRVNVRRKAATVRNLLAHEPVVAAAVRELKGRFEPGLAVLARAHLNATADKLVIDGLTPAEKEAFEELETQLRASVAVAAARCKALLPDGRISAEDIHSYIIYELHPEPIANRIATAWLGDRVDVVGLPPEAPEAIQFRLEPGQIATVFREASQADRNAHNKAIHALQKSWGYLPLNPGGRPNLRQDDSATAERARIAARLSLSLSPHPGVIAHVLGIGPDNVAACVEEGVDLLRKEQGERWATEWTARYRELTRSLGQKSDVARGVREG